MSEARKPHSELFAIVRRALSRWIPESPDEPGLDREYGEAQDALRSLEEQYEGMKARFDSYAPGTVEGQVRASWDLAEHHGHSEFSSKPGIVYLEKFISGLLEQLEAIAGAMEALWDTRILTGETAHVNTRELRDLRKLVRGSFPASEWRCPACFRPREMGDGGTGRCPHCGTKDRPVLASSPAISLHPDEADGLEPSETTHDPASEPKP